ncbi:AEC family transporter [Paenibacillus sp. N1-5-1-14]|uniref:AEC family transporter n=1 Tax=Paenibacillus radicibacter TaxID=2972488 RepID=UPI00215971B8|nr:AEC family transporter [Paenibacillus radicibacter]MCR8644465.1 AEC family transporter [Paenibacillus radicibacter]
MFSMLTFIQELVLMYMIGLLGYLLRKKGILQSGSEGVLTSLILYVTLPALILYGMDIPFSITSLKHFLWLSLMSFSILTVSSIIAFLTVRRLRAGKLRRNALEGIMIFGNQGFLGVAISYLLFGKNGVLLATLFNFVYLIFIWTYAIYLFARAAETIQWRKVFFNPGILATLLGLILLLLPGTLPHVLQDTLEMLGKPTVPLSMLLIGVLLGGMNAKVLQQFVKDRYLWLASLYKLMLFPLLLLPFYWLSVPFELLTVAVILAGMPSAPTISIFAHQYREDSSYAAAGVAISTLLSIVTIPILYGLLYIIMK